MKLASWVISIVIFGLILGIGIKFLADASYKYDVDLYDDQFSNTTEAIEDVYGISTGMMNDTYGSQIEEDEAWESGIKGSYKGILRIPATIGIASAAMTDIQNAFGIDNAFGIAAITILTLLVVSAFWFFFTGRKE